MAGKILVAEDDAEARQLLLLVLGGQAYHLLEAADGVEALRILRSEQPDLLITDVVMPRMDGYELVRKLRQDERTAKMPVIFCSASYHEREVREMARSLGVRSMLSKPFDVDTVHAVVQAALSSSTAGPHILPWSPASVGEMASAAQERLTSLTSFSRALFMQTEPTAIVQSACHAAREVLFAQCAQLVVNDGGRPRSCIASGLDAERVQQLLSAQLYRDLVQSVEAGGCAVFPMSPSESVAAAALVPPGEFVSMLGVPVASGMHTYGYLSVVNRIGLTGFTDEDLAVARAVAAQVAGAFENAQRHGALQAQIAQRKAAEEQVRRLNEELEHRVAERTAELQVVNRELEAFSYSVAHDLRAPLRLIHAHVQMLRDLRSTPLSREVSNHLMQIQRGAGQMSALIDGLLALSRVSHVEMSFQPTPLHQLVQQAIEPLAHEARGRKIEWRVSALPTVSCDPELMLQVFANLLGNAVKYSQPRAQTVIEVGVAVDQGQAHVFVRDNGVGFDMRYAGKLFGVFQRLHRQDEFEGTGIGLATVSRIVERHGGKIWAESVSGQGTVFRFTLAGL